MSVLSELRLLPFSERLQLVEELWNSIVEDQDLLTDPPLVVAELRARKARFLADRASAVPWEQAREQITRG
jgi:putative addiction module component (TIGR02574 family)